MSNVTALRPRGPGYGVTNEPATLFGLRLRQARESRGLSQADLAEQSGYHYSTISRIESGSRQPSMAVVNRLVDVMRLTEVEADALRAAAGYAPVRVGNLSAGALFGNAPVLRAVYQVLSDPNLPAAAKADLVQTIAAAVNLARRAVQS